jgi:hypothetical protein
MMMAGACDCFCVRRAGNVICSLSPGVCRLAGRQELVSCDEEGWIKFWNLPELLPSIAGTDGAETSQQPAID